MVPLASDTHELIFTAAQKNPRGRAYGGQAFFLRKNLKHELIQEFDFGLLISINLNGKKIYFCGVYMIYCSPINKTRYQEQLNHVSGLI
jgi:hypothetical protein